MPPKSKAEAAKKEKIAEDKTFGMKNKNKSKTVQKYIKSISQNAGSSKTTREVDEAHAAKGNKDKELQKAALMAGIFNQSVDKKGRNYDPIAKKQAKQQEEESIAAGKKLKDDVRKAIIEGIANSIRLTDPKGVRMSELGGHPIIHALKDKFADTFKILSLLLFIKANKEVFWVDDGESSNPMIRCTDDVNEEIDPDDRPIEEVLEERRKALPPGGTPVTLLTFNMWKTKKENERIEAALQTNKDARTKDKTNIHAGLSGRDLFTFDKSLFVDDEDAAGEDAYDERSSVCSSEDAPKAELIVEDEDGAEGAEGGAEGEEGEEGEKKAKGSTDAPVISNANLFLDGDDELPDDLDDLSD